MHKDDNQGGASTRPEGDDQPAVFNAQRAMLDATSDCIKVLSPDGLLLAMNEAGRVALGIAPAQVRGVPWIPLLPASVQAAACEALALALTGVTARFAGHSEASGQVVHWDNLMTPVVGPSGQVFSVVCVSRDVSELVLLQHKLDRLLLREQLLSGEMLHRIKNLFTVSAAVMMMADREARASGKADQLAMIAEGKLKALSRVYDKVLATDDLSSVQMRSLVKAVLLPFGNQCRFSGARHLIPEALANLLALVLHELATNSVKHGSLSVPQGQVHISWKTAEGRLALKWLESAGPRIIAPPDRCGYGTQMIDQLASTVGGVVDRRWHAHGLHVELQVPLDRA